MNVTQFLVITFGYNRYPLFKPRYYSTRTTPILDPPVSILTIDNLQDKDYIKSKRIILNNKAGIYAFINNVNGKKYIGSAKDFYLRLNEHISNRKSNSALQLAFSKYGLENFSFCVYEYFTYENKVVSSKLLTDLETSYISKFEFNSLYNYMKTATSLEGYKHTEQAKLKMAKRFINKSDHPF
jgi:hypothetical protein